MNDEKQSYKSNNELFEMVQDLKDTIKSFGFDLKDTNTKIREYNGLRQAINDLQQQGCSKQTDWDMVHQSIKRMEGFMQRFESIDEHRNKSLDKVIKVVAVVAAVGNVVLALVVAFS